MDLILIRHGQSIANLEGKLISDKYDSLSNKGIIESKKLALVFIENQIQPTYIYSSPWKRAHETAKYLFSNDSSFILDERLAETNPGKFGTWLESDFNHKFPEFNKNIENSYDQGESHLDMANRVCSWVDEEVITKITKPGLISVVTHGGPISVILQYLLGIKIETKYPSFSFPNASYSILKWRPELNRYWMTCAGNK
jgi:broad specificity phosphatase PhoE